MGAARLTIEVGFKGSQKPSAPPLLPRASGIQGYLGLLPVRGHPKRAAGRVREQSSRAEKSNVSAKKAGSAGTATPPERATAQDRNAF